MSDSSVVVLCGTLSCPHVSVSCLYPCVVALCVVASPADRVIPRISRYRSLFCRLSGRACAPDRGDDEIDVRSPFWTFSRTPFRRSLMSFESHELEDVSVRMFNSTLVYTGLESVGRKHWGDIIILRHVLQCSKVHVLNSPMIMVYTLLCFVWAYYWLVLPTYFRVILLVQMLLFNGSWWLYISTLVE